MSVRTCIGSARRNRLLHLSHLVPSLNCRNERQGRAERNALRQRRRMQVLGEVPFKVGKAVLHVVRAAASLALARGGRRWEDECAFPL